MNLPTGKSAGIASRVQVAVSDRARAFEPDSGLPIDSGGFGVGSPRPRRRLAGPLRPSAARVRTGFDVSSLPSNRNILRGEMARDYERTLGVVEAFTVVCEQCPSGAVRGVAERALEAAKQAEPGALKRQAYFVLTAIQGWRGERASQVHRSLTEFIDGA